MKTRIKLIGTIAGLFTLVSFHSFGQTKTVKTGDSTSITENQTGKVTEWKEQAPTSAGWRTVRPGMTVDELISAMPGIEARKKKSKIH